MSTNDSEPTGSDPVGNADADATPAAPPAASEDAGTPPPATSAQQGPARTPVPPIAPPTGPPSGVPGTFPPPPAWAAPASAASTPWPTPVGQAPQGAPMGAPWAGDPSAYHAGGAPPPQPTLSGKAIASLVSSLVYACGIGSIAGIVLGHLAWRDINRSHGRLNGRPLAVIGMILGYVGLAVTLVIGGDMALTALNDSKDPGTTGSPQPMPSAAPSQPSPNDIGTPCPAASFLNEVTPPNTTFNLGGLQRSSTTGVLVCVYGQPTEPDGGLTVLVELQDSLSTASVDEYFAERELTPPTATQLGDASGTAERFGFDEYPFRGTDVLYRDTAAARGNLAAYLSIPQEWDIPSPVQFEATVNMLNDIGVGSGANSVGEGGTSPQV